MIFEDNFTISTGGFCDIKNITSQIQEIIKRSKIREGIALVFVKHSTAAITIIEVDANLEMDLEEALELIAPQNKKYHHDEKRNDGNGFSHVRASLIGPSLSVSISDNGMELGAWQRIVLCDFDNKSRDRDILVKIIGE